jgi:hypothetical protein
VEALPKRVLMVCPRCKGQRVVLVPTLGVPLGKWLPCPRCDAEGAIRVVLPTTP